MRVTLDWETANPEVSLVDVGAWAYWEHPLTEVLCLCAITDFGYGWEWIPGLDPEPPGEFALWAADPEVIFEAHSAAFEQAGWHYYMVGKLGLPPVPPERWDDTMARAFYRGMPGGLDPGARALGLSEEKDKEGRELTLNLSKPMTKKAWLDAAPEGWTRAEWGRWYPENHYDRRPETLRRVARYCTQDVKTEIALGEALGPLSPYERRVWELDQRINQRGLKIDRRYIAACKRVVAVEHARLGAEFDRLTGGLAPTQTARLVDWCQANGAPQVMSLAKDTLKSYGVFGLAEDQEEEDDTPLLPAAALPAQVRRVLEIRSVLGSSSISKLDRMLDCANSDNRVRYTQQYHGAGTGRTAGRLFQPTNLPRGKIEGGHDPEALVDAIMMAERDAIGACQFIEMVFGEPIAAVASGLRHAVVAEDGREFNTGDFAGIEMRVVLALAGQHDKCELLATGKDVYLDMACDIYGVPKGSYNKVEHVPQRTIGKNTVLGCFGADTPVLTSRGIHAISEVRSTDLLWDGVEWVTHGGLLDQGLRQTIIMQGISVTPEHLALCGARWLPMVSLARDEGTVSQALATGSAHLPSWVTDTVREAGWSQLSFNALAERRRTASWIVAYGLGSLPVATPAPKSKQGILGKHGVDTLASFLTTLIGRGFLTGSRRVSTAATTQMIGATSITGDAGFWFMRHGVQIVERFWHILSSFPAGMMQRLTLTAKTMKAVTPPAIYGSLHASKTKATGVTSPCSNNACSTLKCVYDIANAGPRARFTIITDAGPLIVHNCGFQMGGDTFWNRYCPDQTLEFAQGVVRAYREVWAPMVPKVWAGLEAAALDAVVNQGRARFHGIDYEWVKSSQYGNWLACHLPDGQIMWYRDPVYDPAVPLPWGGSKPGWRYSAWKFGQWRRVKAYGGLLTENAVQKIARGLLVAASYRLEEQNLPLVLTVYDECMSEVLLARSDHKAYEQIMREPTDYARAIKIPIDVEGWAGPRYKK